MIYFMQYFRGLQEYFYLQYTLFICQGISSEATGTGETDGYNRLDLVKHTLNTIVTSLTEHDKICIIKFSTVAQVFSNLTNCSDDNKDFLKERIKRLDPEGQTNIWDALRLTLDQIAAENELVNDYNVQIYLLTDGEPNINPPGKNTYIISISYVDS